LRPHGGGLWKSKRTLVEAAGFEPT